MGKEAWGGSNKNRHSRGTVRPGRPALRRQVWEASFRAGTRAAGHKQGRGHPMGRMKRLSKQVKMAKTAWAQSHETEKLSLSPNNPLVIFLILSMCASSLTILAYAVNHIHYNHYILNVWKHRNMFSPEICLSTKEISLHPLNLQWWDFIYLFIHPCELS